ncbi:MAG: reprolysin-like metallopeptidase [Saprospiraceae bacterium]
MLKKLLCLTVLLSIGLGQVFAQNLWTDVQERAIQPVGQRVIVPQKYRTVALDLAAIRPVLAAAPERFAPAAADNETVLQIPMPDGSFQRFRLFESPVMERELQAKYPDIRCYTGAGIDDPSATMKCDLTPQGFHAMILAAGQSPVFVDPYSMGDTERYISYYKKDYTRKDGKDFVCETDHDFPISLGNASDYVSGPDMQGDCQLRKYRLALACTGEYANFHGATGANKAPALAAMNTTMNRVNGVYERETAVTMMLIANNDLLIYTNASTDPYSNNSGGTMLGQNVTTINQVIGVANYDMGHVFSTGGGGIAGLGVICTASKARGVTGLGSPVGDGFDIDYVAHEMGHQFGGNHTFNSNQGSCNGNQANSAAMEPGSGITIMAYAGICGSHNIAAHSDDYFHAISLQEIGNFITNGNGNSCAAKTVTGNKAPVVNAGPDRIIPKSTPFALTATGSDADNDPITYCWEQMDPETATMPPVATNTVGPLFRTFPPTTSPTRIFPRLSDLNSNTNYTWEKLPSVARTMKFRVTIRDNHAGAGCTEEDDMTVTVNANAGPFVVTEPNTNVTWFVGEAKTVTWNVANTNTAPVNCTSVKILLSTDGGLTYPIVLADGVPNNGSAPVTVPNNVSTTCRVKVESVGNIFFDISNVNFRIQIPPTPTFLLTTSSNSLTGCAGETPAFNINFTSLLNFNDPVNLTVAGLPTGATATIFFNPALPLTNPIVPVQIEGLTPAMAGNYTLTVTGTSGTIVQTANVALTVQPGAPTQQATATTPADGAGGVALNTSLNWSAIQFAQTTYVEVSTSPAFDNIIFTNVVSGSTAQVSPPLAASTVYYWRVQGSNDCGTGPQSSIFAFQTGKEACNQTFASTNVPIVLSPTAGGLVSSKLAVGANKFVTDVNLTTNIAHVYVGDLQAWLVSPANDTVQLFDQPGVPTTQYGCSGDNIVATFDDESLLQHTVFENACNTTTPPAISGTFKPLASLNKFDGENAQGDWTLLVNDAYATEDGGQLNSWSLNFCFADPVLQGNILANNPLTVPNGATRVVPTANLRTQTSAAASQVVYVLLTVPQHGTLAVNGNTLAVGGTFTQANIDGNQLAYTHDGGAATSDNFHFDVLDQNNAAWVHDGIFQILITQNSLAVLATQTADIQCAGQATGQITVTATGGAAPLSYSLNGGTSQSDNVFSGLAAGSYTVVVTDADGFAATANTVQIDAPTAVSASASVATDVITVTATGGTGAYGYSIDGQNFITDNTFENVPNGAYTITVRDANGCTATTTALVAVNSLVASLAITSNVSCVGNTDGSITATVAGGEAPYQYSLNGGAFQDGNTFSDLAAGTYSVEIQDALGFTITTNEVTLTDPTLLTASASADLNSVTVTATGGTGTFEYSIDGAVFQAGNTFSDLANGDYTVTVRDGNGCTATATVSISVAPLSATVSVDVLIACAGGEATLVVNAIGGIPPYRYRLDGNPFQNSNTFTNVLAGTHTIRVRDDAGTVFIINDFEVTEPTPVVANASVFSNDLTATATGGNPPYTFALTNGLLPPFNDLPNGNYTVVATDAFGCTGTAEVTVNYTALSATTQIGGVSCAGGNDGRILVNAAGGVPPRQFSLNGGAFQASGLFTNLTAGTYDITIQDGAGDQFVLTGLVVTEPPALVFTTSEVTLNTLTVSASGGTGNIQYSLNGGTYQASGTFTSVPAGTHTITAKDENNCTVAVTLTVLFEPLSASADAEEGTCVGTATGTAVVCVNGGSGTFSFNINPGAGTFAPSPGICEQNYRFENLPAGNYTVIVTDITTGQTLNLTFTIEAFPLVGFTVSNNVDDIIVTVASGTSPYQYSLNGGPAQSSNIFPDLPKGTYTVWVIDANGCTSSQQYVLDYVGTVEPGAAWGVAVQPNPSTGLFQISVQNAPANALNFKVFDAAGRLVRSEFAGSTGTTFSQTLDLTDLPAGLYLLQISDGQSVGALRLAKF